MKSAFTSSSFVLTALGFLASVFTALSQTDNRTAQAIGAIGALIMPGVYTVTNGYLKAQQAQAEASASFNANVFGGMTQAEKAEAAKQ